MYLVDNPTKTAQKDNQSKGHGDEALISLLRNIVETACEHEPDLGLMRLINLMDLYRIHLQLADTPLTHKSDGTGSVSFEEFVKDTQLLSVAASAASLETGEKVAVPLPLAVSANA